MAENTASGHKWHEPEIEFQGQRYLLIGSLENGGAIATQEQFDNFDISYAHLFPDGTIRRFNKQIGTRADITVKTQPTPTP